MQADAEAAERTGSQPGDATAAQGAQAGVFFTPAHQNTGEDGSVFAEEEEVDSASDEDSDVEGLSKEQLKEKLREVERRLKAETWKRKPAADALDAASAKAPRMQSPQPSSKVLL